MFLHEVALFFQNYISLHLLYSARPPDTEQLLGLLRQLELCLHVFLHEVALFLALGGRALQHRLRAGERVLRLAETAAR